MISFVLPGRRTLSEHLPAETIDVPRPVVQRSKYLLKVIIEQGLTYPNTWKFSLPRVDPIGFRMYIEWLESGHVEFSNTTSTASVAGLLLRDAFDLVFAHIAGTQLEEPDFQDYVIDTTTNLLNVSQTPDIKVLEVVFLENGASNLLKQFIVDKMFAVERKMLGMMRGRVEDSEGQEGETGCKYHAHKAGECYRAQLSGNIDNRANISHASHRGAQSNRHPNHSHRPGLASFSNPSSNSLASTFFEPATYDMGDDQYFGSAQWSREVHGLQRRDSVRDLHMNKPLPNIPPLTPGSSPTPPLSLRSLPKSTLPNHNRRRSTANSTQQLVFECLSRLPTTDDRVSNRAGSEPDLHRSQIPSLVLECLERFKSSYSDGESSGTASSTRVSSPYLTSEHDQLSIIREQSPVTPSSDSTPYPTFDNDASPTLLEQSVPPIPPHSMSDRCTLPTLREQSPSPTLPSFTYDRSPSLLTLKEHIPPPSQTAILVPGPQRRVHWAKSFDTLPKPWLEADAQIYEAPVSPIERAHSFLVKRKTAPPRGTDWLEQYDRINDLMGNIPPVLAKRSRRSRFKELLRSESRLGSIRLES